MGEENESGRLYNTNTARQEVILQRSESHELMLMLHGMFFRA